MILSVIKKLVLLVLLSGCLSAGPALAEELLLIDDFENDLSRWNEEVFSGRNDFRLVMDASGSKVLQVASHDSASALIHEIEFSPAEYPLLRWRWKIEATVPSGNARTKEQDDYPARIYVIFPHFFKPFSRTINYIWANKLEIDEVVPSLYFSRSVMVAVESGDQRAGEWVEEKRNLLEDYRRIFGEDPVSVGGIAIMTDSDDTGESARAWYDDLRLQKAD